MKSVLKYILLFSFIFSIDLPEKIIYNAKFKNIGAGQATISTQYSNIDSSNIDINFNLKTKKFVDLFYKLRENIFINIDKNNFYLKYLNKNSEQADYKKKDIATFDYKKKIFKFNNKEDSLVNVVYDPLSIIHFLRNQNLNIDKSFPFDIYSNGKIKKIIMNVIGEETIKIANKQYDCFILAPNTFDKTAVLKNRGELKIWISKDIQRIPVIIEQKAKYGTILLKLKKYEQ